MKIKLSSHIIKNLDKYSKEHFASEENLLRKVNYPDFDIHIKEHNAFKLKTVQSAVNVLKGNQSVSEDTILFLKDGWINHILKVDMEYKKYVNEH